MRCEVGMRRRGKEEEDERRKRGEEENAEGDEVSKSKQTYRHEEEVLVVRME